MFRILFQSVLSFLRFLDLDEWDSRISWVVYSSLLRSKIRSHFPVYSLSYQLINYNHTVTVLRRRTEKYEKGKGSSYSRPVRLLTQTDSVTNDTWMAYRCRALGFGSDKQLNGHSQTDPNFKCKPIRTAAKRQTNRGRKHNGSPTFSRLPQSYTRPRLLLNYSTGTHERSRIGLSSYRRYYKSVG